MSSFTIDTKKAQRYLQKIAARMPDLTARALNNLAWDVREREQRAMRGIFDRPSPFTVRGVLYEKATAAKPEARVFLRDEATKGTPPVKYLKHQVYGGGRQLKRFERAMQRSHVLPSGYYAVPTKYAPMDRYGNVPKGEIVRILSQIQAFGEVGFKANATEKSMGRRWKGTAKKRGSKYFVLTEARGKLPPGIYLRKNYGEDARVAHLGFGGAKPIFIFVRAAPKYRARYPFDAIAQSVVKKRLQQVFKRTLASALSSGRR